jgi:hypothetical protein
MNQDSLQYQISSKLQQEYDTLTKYPVKEVLYMLFRNIQLTDNKISGLRMTKLGFSLLKSQYAFYPFVIGEEGVHKNLLITLHKHMIWPYYIDKKQLVMFSGDDAMWMKMYGNDIEKFTKSIK